MSAEAAAYDTGSRRLVALAALVATFVASLDATVVSTAIPTIVGQLGGIGLYAWVFSGFLLASTVSVPIYGKLADLYGRKPVFLVAVAIFLLGSMLCGQAQSMEQLILFRVLQGLGAGGVQPITLTIIGDVFPLEQRARLTGLFSSAWGVSALVGPAIGGFLTEQWSWRLVFYVNLPVGGLSMLLMWLFLREHVRRRAHQVDYPGALLLSAGVTALLFGLTPPVEGGPGGGLPVPGGPLALPLAAGLLAGFVWWEARAPEPMLPLGLFRQRLIVVSTLAAFLLGALLFGQSAFVPPYLQGVLGASPTTAGFVMTASSLGWPVAAPFAARLIVRVGYRLPAVIGGGLMVIGSGLLATLDPGDSLLRPVVALGLMGVGFGFLSSPVLLAVQNAVAWHQRGVVTSSNQFARSIGGTLGVSAAGALFAASMAGRTGGADPNGLLSAAGRAALAPALLASLQGALADALHTVYLALLLAAGLALLVAARVPGGDATAHAWKPARPPAPPEGSGEDGEPADTEPRAAAVGR